MKRNLLLSLALGASLVLPATVGAEELLAFPGAEGFGRFATGGRGGEIYHVTNLNDSGAGSFRDAVSKPNRIIVFDVSGVIRLKSALVFKGDLTVLGQTAPGEGIQLYGDRVSFSGADNIIVRYLRIRMGVNGPSGKDAAGIAYGGNMIFDQMSVLWGRDENFSVNWDSKKTAQEPHDITIQNSFIGQGLQPHSCGGLIQTSGGVTLFRNLYIENSTRNPKVKGLNQFVNNVLYNWGNGAAYNMGGESDGDSWAEISGNYFVRGPWKSAARPLSGGNSNFRYYAEDNYYDSDLDGVLNGKPYTDSEYEQSGGNRKASLEALDASGSPKPHPAIAGRQTANEAIEWVIAHGGASLPVRDEVDQYLIDELLSYGTLGTEDGISSEKQLPHKGTGRLFGGFKPKDTDNDGIPDEWESANGLNPEDASDAAKIAANGYANIENYVFTITSAYPYIKNPTDLKSIKNEATAIELSWTDNSDDEKEFVIETSSDGKTFTEAKRVEANTTSARVENLPQNATVFFRIKALGDNGLESVYSDTFHTITIDTPTPPEKTELIEPKDNEQVKQLNVQLSWKNGTEEYFGKTRYTVYLGKSSDGMEAIASDIEETTLNPGLLDENETYYWRVDARNDVGVTEGSVQSFKIVPGGTLFYTDFHTTPAEYANSKYGLEISGSQADMVINGTVEIGNMTFSTQGRIVAFGGLKASSYPANSNEDKGASDNAVGFIGKNGKVSTATLTVGDIEGPWKVTVFVGNSDKAKLSFKVGDNYDHNGDGKFDSSDYLATFNITNAAKKTFKFSYICKNPATTDIIFGDVRGDGDKKGLNFFDILVEKYVDEGSGVNEIGSDSVLAEPDVETYDGTLTVNNLANGETVNLYDLSGRVVGIEKSNGGSVSFAPGKGLFIVKVAGKKPVKVIL